MLKALAEVLGIRKKANYDAQRASTQGVLGDMFAGESEAPRAYNGDTRRVSLPEIPPRDDAAAFARLEAEPEPLPRTIDTSRDNEPINKPPTTPPRGGGWDAFG